MISIGALLAIEIVGLNSLLPCLAVQDCHLGKLHAAELKIGGEIEKQCHMLKIKPRSRGVSHGTRMISVCGASKLELLHLKRIGINHVALLEFRRADANCITFKTYIASAAASRFYKNFVCVLPQYFLGILDI